MDLNYKLFTIKKHKNLRIKRNLLVIGKKVRGNTNTIRTNKKKQKKGEKNKQINDEMK